VYTSCTSIVNERVVDRKAQWRGSDNFPCHMNILTAGVTLTVAVKCVQECMQGT
jgi:hypothetical protein